ncbi:RICIN domain-containing protein [Streptomyces sp. NBC_00996]|uniref:RICIN domain-containing protein n=1 Tax=Streptomyces sp. NBC_00996 TaxID=2903710 RepID=UPI00386AD14D|nr:RICIN domain-containing protein [Streptomyces sp. NBC_00996]
MLRRVLTPLLAACASVLALLVVGPPAHAAPVTLPTNPMDFTGTNGDPVDAHGGGMIKVGSYYYLFGENRNDDNTFKAVSVYKSSNLKTWEWVGDALNQKSDPDLEIANIERPKVIYNDTTKKYVMWMHKENGLSYGPGYPPATDYSQSRAAVATSDTVDGPYTYLGSFRPKKLNGEETGSRDQTLYKDEDTGIAYQVTATEGGKDLRIFQLNADYTGYEKEVANPWAGKSREAPALFKRDGVYFMLTSGSSYWNSNQQQYATSYSLSSGWSAMKDVGNQYGYGSQATYVQPVQDSSGNTTSYLFMGDDWAGVSWDPKKVNDSKYVWLPLTFPNKTTMNLPWYPQVEIDTAAGTVKGVGGGTDYNLVARHSDKCVDVKDNSAADNAHVVQFDCNSGLNQQWRLENAGSGYYRILAQHSGKCLAVEDGFTDMAFVNQYNCGSGQNQQWKFEDQGNGYYRLVARHSGLCLDVQKGSAANNARLIQFKCGTGTNQQFKRDTA